MKKIILDTDKGCFLMKIVIHISTYDEKMLRTVMRLAEKSDVEPALKEEINEFTQEIKKQL